MTVVARDVTVVEAVCWDAGGRMPALDRQALRMNYAPAQCADIRRFIKEAFLVSLKYAPNAVAP
jgi:ethanolamine utilization protein EutA (predicted chaperonin)